MDVMQFQPKSKKIICKTLQLYLKLCGKEIKSSKIYLKKKKQNRDFSYQMSDNKVIVMKTV